MPSVPWSRINTALLVVILLAIIGLFASRAYGGPLDPPLPPGPTDGVRSGATPISSLPYSITQPGSYVVTRNLAVTGSNNGISIDADNVTLDLGGFTLSRTDKLWTGIGLPTPHLGVVVRNGQVTGFGEGVNLENASQSRIEGVTSRNNGGVGMRIGSFSIVRDCIISYNQSGIVLGNSSTITGCTVAYNQGHGINMTLLGVVSANEIAYNAVGAAGYGGVYVGGFYGVIKDNDFHGNGSGGVEVVVAGGANIYDNTADQCPFAGGSTAGSWIPMNGVEHSNMRKSSAAYC